MVMRERRLGVAPPVSMRRRSTDHRYGIWCTRSAHSMFGAREAWLTKDGTMREEYESREEAEKRARAITATLTGHARYNLTYTVREIWPGVE